MKGRCRCHGLPLVVCAAQRASERMEKRREIRAQEQLAAALEAARTLDVNRRRKELEGAQEAGARNRKAPPAEVLQRAVLELHARWPHLSWSDACAKVGRQHTPRLSGRTVRRYTAPVKW